MGSDPRSHLAVDADGRVLYPAAIYSGGVLVATGVGAATVAVYDGIDSSGDLIDYFYAATSQRDSRWLGEGIMLRRGLYVDLGSNVSVFAVYYTPTPREKG